MVVVSELIDTTEMYLRTIYELEEEGILPLRARIAERLHQSGPTVSQTVARMERDGLVTVEGDRHLELTEVGRMQATRVMRKHRLAERLLVDVIGLEWEDVHAEACRWEHVMSDAVELRLLKILDNPTESPYGNPIPGLEELQKDVQATAIGEFRSGVEPLDKVLDQSTGSAVRVLVRRIAEPVQTDDFAMSVLRRAGALPGREVDSMLDAEGVLLGSRDAGGVISDETAGHIFVSLV
ncbi:metal-dependent transcriptional regulator [Kribbella sp. ALI-6-A]|jgi:DtxR family transcriptional regulator, Mn-dependent transcriptional regulator|uniref:metal-dependent transcriptional regulator n=1 Tax=Kribbella sp. ALI-6-A TaxID=1933817 RepID=UPI00117B2B7C